MTGTARPAACYPRGYSITAAADWVRQMIAAELPHIKATVSARCEDMASYDQVAKIFETMSLTPITGNS